MHDAFDLTSNFTVVSVTAVSRCQFSFARPRRDLSSVTQWSSALDLAWSRECSHTNPLAANRGDFESFALLTTLLHFFMITPVSVNGKVWNNPGSKADTLTYPKIPNIASFCLIWLCLEANKQESDVMKWCYVKIGNFASRIASLPDFRQTNNIHVIKENVMQIHKM
jgi:hypothetical protein